MNGRHHVAYLISQYPTISHTFVIAEILGLRRLGLSIEVASILEPDRPPECLSEKEQKEHQATFYIRSLGFAKTFNAHVRTLINRPSPYIQGILRALQLSHWNLVTVLRHVRFFSEAIVVGDWMKKKGVTRLHTHFASTVALFVRYVFPIEMSATIHGSDEFKDGVGFLLSEKVRAADFIIAISFYGKGQLMRYSHHSDWHKIRIVRLGANTSEFNLGSHAVPSSRGPYTLVCVGRLASPKTHLLLIEACADLKREGRNVQLSLVGDGPDRAYLEEAARVNGVAEAVIFNGSVRHDLVREYYRRADAFVLASLAEGVPIVLMEAMAMQVPCIATGISGIPELIQDQVDGLLVPPADPESLKAAIRRLMDDRFFSRQLGIAGRQKVLKLFDLERNIVSLMACFISPALD